jgi:dolichol-phosphate mannosyltransferase
MSEGKPLLLSVLIPAHNEEQSIAPVLRDLTQALTRENIPHELLVVDDHSTDNTRHVVDALAVELRTVRCVSNPARGGFGMAVRAGLDAYKGDAVAIVMADASDSPADVVTYYRKLSEGYDCVFGSRFMQGSRVIDYPWLKYVLNRLANLFIRVLFGIPLNDTTNAFKCYRREAIDGATPLLSPHFNLTVELPLKAIARGFSYAIVPISWRNRSHGVAKLKIEEMGSRYLFIVLNVWLERLLTKDDYRRPLDGRTTYERRPAERWWSFAGIAIVLAIACLAPFVALAPFNRPIIDDYLFAKMREVQGYWPAQWTYYTTVYGRYTALAIISLNPMTFGPKYVWFLQVTPVAMIGFLLCSLFYLARSVPLLRDSKKTAAAAAGLGIVAYVSTMPSVWQAFYWWSSQCCFELGNAFMALTLGMLFRLPWSAGTLPRGRVALTGGVAILAMGTNEITAVNLLGGFGLISIVNRCRRPLPRRYWPLAGMVVLGAALALLSPGNLLKFGYSSGYPLPVALREAFAASWRWLATWLTMAATPVLSIAALILFARQRSPTANDRSVPSWAAPAALGALWIVLFVDLLFLYRGVGAGPHPARSMNTVLFALLLMWFVVLLADARTAGRMLAPLARPIVASGLAVLAIVCFVWRHNNITVAYGDLVSGRARTYAREADARIDQMANSPLDIVEFDRYSVYPLTITEPSLELTDDTLGDLNQCVRNYFNKRGVRVTADRTITQLEKAAADFPTVYPRLVYAPQHGDAPPLRELTKVAGDHFRVGDTVELARRATQSGLDPIYMLWDHRYRDDPQAQIWIRHAARTKTMDSVTSVQLSAAAFHEGVAEFEASRAASVERALDNRIAAARVDPLLRWVIQGEYAWTREAYPALYAKVQALTPVSPASPAKTLAAGIGIFDYRLQARDDGTFGLYVFFQVDTPQQEDATVLVHVLPPGDEIGNLPVERRQFHFDDWSFAPDPRTKDWPSGRLIVVRNVIRTDLHRATLRIGLHSPTRGTIGSIDFPERAIIRGGQ